MTRKVTDRNRELKRLYGIDLVEYNRLSDEQDNRCAICKSNSTEVVKGLHVDHCHVGFYVRGLLCQKCNQGLGLFKDKINVMRKAITHLKGKHNEEV